MKTFFFAIILSLLGQTLWSQQNTVQTQIHILHFACSNPDDEACKLNQRTLQLYRSSLFKDLQASGFRVNYREYKEGDFNLNTLRQTINGLKVEANDIVLFLYSGHGSNTDGTATPTLNVSNNIVSTPRDRINLKTIQNQLMGKGARMTIVVGNACNKVQQVAQNSVPGGTHIARNRSNLSILFTNYKGHVLIWSAKKGQSAYGDLISGNYFGESFLDALYEAQSWEQVVMLTKQKTTNIAKANGLAQVPDANLSVAPLNVLAKTTKPPLPTAMSSTPSKSTTALAEAKVTGFLGTSVASTIMQAERVNVYLLYPFKHDGQTFEGFRIRKKIDNLSASQIQPLKSIIGNTASYSFDQLVKNCIFSPLVGVEFQKGNDTVKLLLCTDCDVWRFYNNNTKKEEDFDNAHADVVNWIKTIFPNDPIIKKIN
ncbi:caspase family protein [Runella sp.]|uniref:caspase family protein n=1 Tax=Runella sp. TaxID=1960881 RepID=UPI003019E21A